MAEGASLLSTSAGSVAVIALVLALVALSGMVLLLARQQRLLGQYEHLMTGTAGGNLETILNDHITQVRAAAGRVEDVGQLAELLEERSRLSLQHVGIVRFSPFRDTGGDQSFALVIADDHGHGVVLSSLHARDVTRVYAKPLASWDSPYSLTDEEKKAIALAQQKQA
jgi:hypothetical protein